MWKVKGNCISVHNKAATKRKLFDLISVTLWAHLCSFYHNSIRVASSVPFPGYSFFPSLLFPVGFHPNTNQAQYLLSFQAQTRSNSYCHLTQQMATSESRRKFSIRVGLATLAEWESVYRSAPQTKDIAPSGMRRPQESSIQEVLEIWELEQAHLYLNCSLEPLKQHWFAYFFSEAFLEIVSEY